MSAAVDSVPSELPGRPGRRQRQPQSRFVHLRQSALSMRFERRAPWALATLGALATIAFVLGLACGEYALDPRQVFAALVGTSDPATAFVVTELRLPRATAALVVGAALGVAGFLFQQATRNPLAAPDVLGVTSGAALGAVALIVLLGEKGALTVPVAAALGGGAAGALLYTAAFRRGLSGERLILAGIALAALCHAAISYLLTRARLADATQAYIWLIGTLNSADWTTVLPVGAVTAAGIAIALVLGRSLAVVALGDTVSSALGARPGATRSAAIVTATLLASAAVSCAGPLAFVAFAAPHLARTATRLTGTRATILASALVGATVVSLADLAVRVAPVGEGLPTGIATTLFAAPYFVHLLYRARRREVRGA